MFSEFISTIKTTTDRDSALSELMVLRNNQFQNHKDLEKLLSSTVSFGRAALLLKLNQSTQADFKKIITQLYKQIHDLKTVELTIGYACSDAVVNNIYQFLIDSIGYQIVLRLRIDPRIIAGAIISFEGKYIDLSVEKKLHEYARLHKEKILENFLSRIKS